MEYIPRHLDSGFYGLDMPERHILVSTRPISGRNQTTKGKLPIVSHA
jgi:hypothetical protein